MVAAIAFTGEFALAVDGASEFPAPDDEGFVEHVALFQILEQCGDRLVSVHALVAEFFGEVAMGIPTAVEDLNHADTALDEASGKEGGLGEGAGLFNIGAIAFFGGFGLFAEVGQFRHATLHAVGHLVLGNAGLDVRVAKLFETALVELAEGVEHGAAVGPLTRGDCRGRESVFSGAQDDAGILACEEPEPHMRL